MKQIAYRHINKAEWGDGPWRGEFDKVQFVDLATGLPCLIVRGPMGHLCGYVGVPPSSPFYGMEYDDIPHIEVHGGLTFAGKGQPSQSQAEGICHVVERGESDDVWWLGFDCGHYNDIAPVMLLYMKKNDIGEFYTKGTYRDMFYVRGQVESLAYQLSVKLLPSPTE